MNHRAAQSTSFSPTKIPNAATTPAQNQTGIHTANKFMNELRSIHKPSWAAVAFCIVSLCMVLSFVLCIWKKCLIKKDKDKEKDKKRGKEQSKGGFDTEMDGGYNEVSYRTDAHAHQTHSRT
ncbi:hypothetical protein XENOCAPTIV_004253 [Xenoophorus captivus]|uniref:Synaptotagmin n=1 Tax=Xenoophorus captivus TaxID=1517983 RepID=A0ABV0R327_9TELE